ncbi:hypothetical protein TNCV_4080561 [Trichonephila clavipes]|nr:hypothetical protein TNCV_4080561 [Trichonephila clavipes]
MVKLVAYSSCMMRDSYSDMDSASVKFDKSYKSRSSISSRSDCEKNAMNPEFDCARRRNVMAKLNQLDVLLVDYKKFIEY